jgi:hypothetical protein
VVVVFSIWTSALPCSAHLSPKSRPPNLLETAWDISRRLGRLEFPSAPDALDDRHRLPHSRHVPLRLRRGSCHDGCRGTHAEEPPRRRNQAQCSLRVRQDYPPHRSTALSRLDYRGLDSLRVRGARQEQAATSQRHPSGSLEGIGLEHEGTVGPRGHSPSEGTSVPASGLLSNRV